LERQCTREVEEVFGAVLVSLFKGIACSNNSIEKDLKMKIALEQVCGLINPLYVGNVHYSVSLIAHYITGSSNLVNILNRLFPTVHYSTFMPLVRK
jgi:hypothetical protein